MAIPQLLVDNVSTADIFVEDIGLNFIVGSPRNVLQSIDIWALCRSTLFRGYVSAGSLTIEVSSDSLSSTTYTGTSALNYLDGLAFGSLHAAQHEKGGTDVLNAEKLQLPAISAANITPTTAVDATNHPDVDQLGTWLKAIDTQLGFGRACTTTRLLGPGGVGHVTYTLDATLATESTLGTVTMDLGPTKLVAVLAFCSFEIPSAAYGTSKTTSARLYIEELPSTGIATLRAPEFYFAGQPAVQHAIPLLWLGTLSGTGTVTFNLKLRHDSVADVNLYSAQMLAFRLDPASMTEGGLTSFFSTS